MTTFLSDIVLAGANDIQFKNTAGANTGKIESDGNNLVLSNAVGDILLGDGASDVYVGDGTNSVDIRFEVSGSISGESGAALTLGGAGGTLALGSAISLADYVSAISGTGVNTIDIGTSAKPFKNIYAAHHVGGRSINYATSRGWVEDDNPLSSTQAGEFGGHFVRNGDAAENLVVWGLDPFNNKALLWKAVLNTSDDDDDGGWNKEIVIPANNDIGYLSYVYFKVDFTANSNTDGAGRDGTVYLGAGQVAGETINVSNDNNNTNPYFVSNGLFTVNNGGPVVANRWYLIVGILQAYNNSTTDTDTLAGVYDVETGEKVSGGSEYKMGNNTTGQKHRAYIYYDESTDANENAYFWNPGFHAIDGSEPKIQDLVKRQVYLGDNVKAAFGTGDDLEIYHDGSNSYIDDTGTGNLKIRSNRLQLEKYTGETMAEFIADGGSSLYYDNAKKIETVTGGVEITGNITVSGTVDGIDIATRDAILTSTTTTAGAALPKAGGTMSGAIAMGSQNITGGGTITGTTLTGTSLDINGNADISGDLTMSGHKMVKFSSTTYGAFDSEDFFRIKFQDFGGVHNDVGIGQTATGMLGFNASPSKSFLFNLGTQGNVLTLSNGQATFDGEVEAASLDINGNADISGNLTSANWNGDVIASAYLDTDTAHLSGTQTFSGAKTFTGTVALTGTGRITGVDTVSADTDAASKAYVDDHEWSGGDITTGTVAAARVATLNQNTTGSAETLRTARAINGVDFDGSAAITIPTKAYFEFKGYGTSDGTNYEMGEIMSDTNAPFEHNTSTGSNGLTAQTIQTLMRVGATVMPRAGTLTNFFGWNTSSGSGTVDIGLFKVTPVDDTSGNLTPVLLSNNRTTASGNAKPNSFTETSFSVDFAAGDIIFSAVKGGTSGKAWYFTSTLEVEWN